MDSIEEFLKIHDNRYTYRGRVGKKLEIVCPIHGVFWKSIHHHRNGQGCPACVGKKRIDVGEFINQARIRHGDRYRYDKSVYLTKKTKIVIVCPIHGEFEQTPKKHLIGQGCPRCGGTTKKNQTDFLESAKRIHGDRYNYERVEYKTSGVKVLITCLIHGDFWQTSGKHISGQGCPKCGGSVRMDTSEFIDAAKKTHGVRYGYEGVEYENAKTNVSLKCPTHGMFEQLADNHLRGSGCPTCKISKGQREIYEYVQSLGVKCKSDDRMALDGLEIDVWVPDKNIGIEYHGFAFHVIPPCMGRVLSPGYHREKYERAKKAGIRLVQIAEDEWRDKRPICERIIRYALGFAEKGVGGRNLIIQKIDRGLGNSFLDKNHLQGGCTGIHYGAYEGTVLVGVMVMSKPTRQSQYDWELRRYASDYKTRPGLFSKLFMMFRKQHNPTSVVTFADLRWFSGESYKFGGFTYNGRVAQDYTYIRLSDTHPRRNHKSRFRKQIFLGEGTERNRTIAAGYSRFYDAGKARWVWEAKPVNTGEGILSGITHV